MSGVTEKGSESKFFIMRGGVVDILRSHAGNAREVAVKHLERALIEEALVMCRGNQYKTAKLLGMHRTTLATRLVEFGLR